MAAILFRPQCVNNVMHHLYLGLEEETPIHLRDDLETEPVKEDEVKQGTKEDLIFSPVIRCIHLIQ